MTMELFDLTDSPADLARFDRFFHELYVSGFPDPDERESPENMIEYLRLRAAGWYGANNYHILLLTEDDRPVAAAVSDYLAIPNTGVIEFLIVADDCRGKGYGRKLFDATEKLLQEDASRNKQPALAAIVIELNDPFRVAPPNDNHDPFERTRIWAKWGFGRLNFPYVQPALSEDQEPVRCLILGAKPLVPELQSALPAAMVRQILIGYLKWAMRIADPEADATFQLMAAYLDGLDRVPLTSLLEYIGHDSARPFEVVPIVSTEAADFPAVREVYCRGFPEGPTAVEPSAFGNAFRWAASQQHAGLHYHLWGLRETSQRPMAGMVSFFTMKTIGFGGYIVWEPPLRGTNRTRLLLARIEEQMIRDESAVTGWYIECAPHSAEAAAFLKVGFVRVPVRYHQASLDYADKPRPSCSLGPEQWLLYKRLGADYAPCAPPPEQVLTDIAHILHDIYRVIDPQQTPVYQMALSSIVKNP